MMTISCSKEEVEVNFDDAISTDALSIYTNLTDDEMNYLIEGFKINHNDLSVQFAYISSEEIENQMNTEAKLYDFQADVLWFTNVDCFDDLKINDYFEKYKPKNLNVKKEFLEKDNAYFQTSSINLGFVYNENKTDIPKSLKDLENVSYKNVFFTNPNNALISKKIVYTLMNNEKYGEGFFKKLKNNGIILENSFSQVLKNVEKNKDAIGFMTDYSFYNDFSSANINFSYFDETVSIPTYIALVKNAYNKKNADEFINYALSNECAERLSYLNFIPSREDFDDEKKNKIKNVNIIKNNGTKIQLNDVLNVFKKIIFN